MIRNKNEMKENKNSELRTCIGMSDHLCDSVFKDVFNADSMKEE